MESKHFVQRAWHIKRRIQRIYKIACLAGVVQNWEEERHKEKGGKESLSSYSLILPFFRLSQRPAFYRIFMDFKGSRISRCEGFKRCKGFKRDKGCYKALQGVVVKGKESKK